MPRPKPPAPLKARYVRLSDEEWLKFKEIGGAEWLRKAMSTRPRNYYEVFQHEYNESDIRFVKRKYEERND
jgi:hypothetical protein